MRGGEGGGKEVGRTEPGRLKARGEKGEKRAAERTVDTPLLGRLSTAAVNTETPE